MKTLLRLILVVSLPSFALADPPVVRVTAPLPSDSLAPSAKFTARADATAAAGRTIAKVEFFVWSSNLRVGIATTAPYTVEVTPRELFARSRFSLIARATDDRGAATDSEPVWLTMADTETFPTLVAPRATRWLSRHIPGSGHEGIPALVELPNGDLLSVFYAGRYELSDDNAIYLARLQRGAAEWETPRIIVPGAGVPRVNPVLMLGRDGTLTCFYSNIESARNFEYARPCYRISRDGGATWGVEQRMPEPRFDEPTGTIFAIKPLHLADGTILLPANRESNNTDPLRGWTSLFYRSTDDGRTWTETPELRSAPGNIQPTAQQLADGSLVAFFRPRGRNAKLWRSTSTDGGATWAPLEKTPLDNPSTRSDFVVLSDGSLVLACNPSPQRRAPVSLLLSRDGGKTWPVRRDLETGPGPAGYTAVLLARDGNIHVAYDVDRYAIKHVVVDRAWFDEPPIAAQPSRL
ncbi:MAG: exo-alpha-sialidase [Opitutaceae bacterium]|nr:exo-alpha-sialidase [Opitutaceae bacterium]